MWKGFWLWRFLGSFFLLEKEKGVLGIVTSDSVISWERKARHKFWLADWSWRWRWAVAKQQAS
jgi:hypothetical protein